MTLLLTHSRPTGPSLDQRPQLRLKDPEGQWTGLDSPSTVIHAGLFLDGHIFRVSVVIDQNLMDSPGQVSGRSPPPFIHPADPPVLFNMSGNHHEILDFMSFMPLSLNRLSASSTQSLYLD